MLLFGISCFWCNGSSAEPLGTTALCTITAVVATEAVAANVVTTAAVASKDESSSLAAEWRGLVCDRLAAGGLYNAMVGARNKIL